MILLVYIIRNVVGKAEHEYLNTIERAV
jgi:hypothetical protein